MKIFVENIIQWNGVIYLFIKKQWLIKYLIKYNW